MTDQSISKLTPWERNPRTIDDKAREGLRSSLAEYGDLSGIVFNITNSRLVSGHQRTSILPPDATIEIDRRYDTPTRTGTVAEGSILINGERLRYREVSWTEEKHAAANIVANSHLISGEYTEELAKILTELEASMPELSKDLRFDDLKAEFPEFWPKPEVAEDDVPPAPAVPRTQPGDLIELGNHRLLCGDSTVPENVARLMNGKRSAMVFTDPPYNVNYGKDQKNHPGWKHRGIANDNLNASEWELFCKALFTAIKENNDGDIYVWGASGPEGMRMRLWLIEMGCHWSATIIWKKQQLVLSPAKYQRMYEPCFYGWFGTSSFIADRKQVEVWEFDRPRSSEEHPTMKPLDLCANGIGNSSKPKDIVLDFFLGSGSTLIAADKIDRVCYGLEIDPSYCDVIINRYVKHTGNAQIKVNGQEVTWGLS